MARMFNLQFRVIGPGPFPIDMLRYDQCYPVDPESVAEIDASMSPEERQARREEGQLKAERPKLLDVAPPLFQVTLRRLGATKTWMPTAGRWQSFSWQVDSTSIRRSEAT